MLWKKFLTPPSFTKKSVLIALLVLAVLLNSNPKASVVNGLSQVDRLSITIEDIQSPDNCKIEIATIRKKVEKKLNVHKIKLSSGEKNPWTLLITTTILDTSPCVYNIDLFVQKFMMGPENSTFIQVAWQEGELSMGNSESEFLVSLFSLLDAFIKEFKNS